MTAAPAADRLLIRDLAQLALAGWSERAAARR